MHHHDWTFSFTTGSNALLSVATVLYVTHILPSTISYLYEPEGVTDLVPIVAAVPAQVLSLLAARTEEARIAETKLFIAIFIIIKLNRTESDLSA